MVRRLLLLGLACLAVASPAAARPRVDSGACLQPVEKAQLAEPPERFLRQALGLSDAAVVVALVTQPSFRPGRVISLRRAAGGRRSMRVTRLVPAVWGPVVRRVVELQGSSVRAVDDEQLRTLVEVAVRSSTVERALDRRTAALLEQLWHALVRRVQVVHTDPGPSDGTRYEFWAGRQSGVSVAPSEGSVIQQATFAAERLARIVEAPPSEDDAVVVNVREDLKAALARALRKEPCVRTVRR